LNKNAPQSSSTGVTENTISTFDNLSTPEVQKNLKDIVEALTQLLSDDMDAVKLQDIIVMLQKELPDTNDAKEKEELEKHITKLTDAVTTQNRSQMRLAAVNVYAALYNLINE
jgi:hypothetical protein